MTSFEHFDKLIYKLKKKIKKYFSSPRLQYESVAWFGKKDFVTGNYGTHSAQITNVFIWCSNSGMPTGLKYTRDIFGWKTS